MCTKMRQLGFAFLTSALVIFSFQIVSAQTPDAYHVSPQLIQSIRMSPQVYTQFRVNRPIHVMHVDRGVQTRLQKGSVLEMALSSDIFFEALLSARQSQIESESLARAYQMFVENDSRKSSAMVMYSSGNRPTVPSGDRIEFDVVRELNEKNISLLSLEPDEPTEDPMNVLLARQESLEKQNDKLTIKSEQIQSVNKRQETEAKPSCVDCSRDSGRVSYSVPISQNIKSEMISQYSLSQEVQKMLRSARSNALPASSKYCYRYVKRALYKSGLVSSSEPLSELAAKNAGKDLEKNGFSNLLLDADLAQDLRDPRNAPPGAILVYEGGTRMKKCGGACGHVEIKVGAKGKGGFVSDYYSERPVTESSTERSNDRRLIGVYVKLISTGRLAMK